MFKSGSIDKQIITASKTAPRLSALIEILLICRANLLIAHGTGTKGKCTSVGHSLVDGCRGLSFIAHPQLCDKSPLSYFPGNFY